MSTKRLVVSCRLAGALCLGATAPEGLARFELLVERARVLGGTLVASSFDALVFAWDAEDIQQTVSFATAVSHAPPGEQPCWACAVASGELVSGKPSPPGGVQQWWGEALALSSVLARVARLGEVLVHQSVPAVAANDLLTTRARTARIGAHRVRGVRVESRQPWRAIAAADIARMVDPPLVGQEAQISRLMAATDVIVLRADSGFGGSRMLAEVAVRTRPSRSITLSPLAMVHEPLGALRRAMAFIAATERITIPPNLHGALDRLLGADGVTVDEAAALVAHQIRRKASAPVPSILLDNVADIDTPSVEACSRAVELLGHSVRVVARLDSMSQLPRSMAMFCDGEEVALGRLDAGAAEALVVACTGGLMEPKARVQWARRGGGTPLGVVETVAAGIVQGELLWTGDALGRLRRSGDKDVARPAAFWALQRVGTLRQETRDVLSAIAHLGGEASVTEIFDVVAAVAPHVNLQAEVIVLQRGRWIREAQPGTFSMTTRTHRDTVLQLTRPEVGHDWAIAAAKTLEHAGGTLRRAEAAHLAAAAGMGEWACRLATIAARTAGQIGLEASAASLAAFADEQDRMGETGNHRSAPGADDTTEVASFDAILTLEELDADVAPNPPSRSFDIDRSSRRGAPMAALDLPFETASTTPPAVSYEALLASARELPETRWVEVARRALTPGSGHRQTRRGLLALARAYAADGRSHESLIHGLTALARMREADDRAGARTCLLLLSQIYEQTGRRTEAFALKRAARSAASSAPPRPP